MKIQTFLPAILRWGIAGILFFSNTVHADEPPIVGHLTGRVVDTETGEPVGWTQILVKEAHRSTISRDDGTFVLPNVPVGRYVLSTFRIGYKQTLQPIEIKANDTLTITIRIAAAPLTGNEIVIEDAMQSDKKDIVLEMSGKKLRQNLGKTVAETVAGEPGMDQRSMGPAPARPVLRGLSGDRLLILEDGGRTGDLSASSADHAVVIDPITSERIEVIRGPATLLYGSNTLGGVVNVERGYVPSAALEGFHGNVSGQGETVNKGYSAGAVLTGPYRKIGWRLDLSARDARDISTPAGNLKNTGIQTINGSAGASYFWDWGFAGAAGSYYQSEYGIPGGFVGAHPNGVKIKLDRTHFEGKLDVHFEGGRFERTELRYGYSKYFHREFESNGSVGTQFSVLNYDLTWLTHLRPFWKLGKGEIGVWTEYRDYVPGGFIFTPDTKEWTMAAFAYEKATLGNWKWEGSLRLDHRRVDPSVEEITDIGLIRKRSYTIVSGATSLAYRFGEHVESGVSVMRSARAPGIEELYSQGPHLAAYSFEVGNPDLQSEHGWGLEWFGKWRSDKTEIDLSIFRNDIRDYIFPRNSGAIHIATQLPIYQYHGQHAIMTGGEFKWNQQLPWSSSLSVTASYVRGELADSSRPLPTMPPLAGKVEVKKQISNLTLSAFVRAADGQDRVDRFEDPTDGYVVVDASLQYHRQHKNLLHTWVLSVENIGDTEYRRHLSRVRSIMPEPGRNIKLLYKVFF